MIAKHVAMRSAQKGGFDGLLKYITDSQGKSERVGDIRVTNCYSDLVEQAMLQIINTQAKNQRATADKNYHLIISLAPGESPDEKVLAAIEERICFAIGFKDHQRISVVHHDTDSLHVHVAINKIHPQRYTIHEPYNAYHTLGKVCAKLEKEFRLQKVDHTAKKGSGDNHADDMEKHADVESLLGWIKRECTAGMQNAQNWDAMHAVMHAKGLKLHERANGLVISSDAGISVKASSVAREFSKASLEARLGVFQPTVSHGADPISATRYSKQPLKSRVDTSELYAHYKGRQYAATGMRAVAWAKARQRKQEQLEAAKRKGRLKRAAIKLLSMPRIEKQLLYAATSQTLRKEIQAINKAYLQERQKIYERYERGAWSDWLRDQAKAGNPEALSALRARPAAVGLKGNTLRGTGDKPRAKANVEQADTVTKNGTLIYRVGKSAVRDDGCRLKISRGADRDGIEAALRMAIARYGECITVNGSAEFKEQIARAAAASRLTVRFDDATLERRRRQLTQPLKAKEKHHDNDNRITGARVGRRPDRGSDGRGKQASSSHAPVTSWAGARRSHGRQPDPGGARQPPPSSGTHGVRRLSQLSLVHVADRSEVLLPGHVPGHVEHQGAKPDHRVRRRVRRPGRLKQPKAGLVSPLHLSGRTTDVVKNRKVPPAVHSSFKGTVKQIASAAAGSETRRLPRRRRPPSITSKSASASAQATKPNVGKVGAVPPPTSKDRLRPISKLGEVTIRGSIMVKPRAAGNQPAQPMIAAAHVPPSPLASEATASPSKAVRAAEKYVIEREQERRNGFDISKYSRYNFGKDMPAIFAGLRQVDGQILALLKIGEEIFVKPVDERTARSLERSAIGQRIELKAFGVIKTKGRSR